MGYYDGNTVTALWNYAQHFAMSDNSFNTTFGPSTPGALNLVSGQTHGFTPDTTSCGTAVTARHRDRRSAAHRRQLQHARHVDAAGDDADQNVGDLLNAQGITWGWFEGGFRGRAARQERQPDGEHVPDRRTRTSAGVFSADYIPHHEPFQYYRSTPNLAPPAADLGRDDRQDRPGESPVRPDRLLGGGSSRQPAGGQLPQGARLPGRPRRLLRPARRAAFLVDTINRLEQPPDWASTAVIIAYDDSDGWYDHADGADRQPVEDPRTTS